MDIQANDAVASPGLGNVPVTDVIDNRETYLARKILTTLPQSKRLSSAVGFFFLSGLREVAEGLASVDKVRLLIGNTSTRETIEQLAEAYHHLDPVNQAVEGRWHSKRTERSARLRDTADSLRESIAMMDQGTQDERLIRLLIEMCRSKRLQTKVYTRGRLNGRAHIFDYRNTDKEPGIGIVGSSNLTLAGVQDPTELNVVVRDTEGIRNHAALTEWFDRLWDEAQDFDPLLMQELEASWAAKPVSPWDIYLKTLYTLVQSRGDDETDALFDDEITQSLADFQKVAVQQAVSLIRRHRGCFVADVVGLGKSFIGAAIVKHFERTERLRALIICPKPLEGMWKRYNERYALNAAVVPMSLLMTSERGIDLFESYPDRDFVLIDESHAFRNAGSQRYEALSTYLQAEDRKLCLLTATPRNSRARDVYNQIKLFHPEEMTDLPIDPPDLQLFFQGVEDGTFSLKDVLRHVMIRRTRHHILRWWGITSDTRQPMVELNDEQAEPYLTGEKRCFIRVGDRENYFPRRELSTIRYSIEETYEGLYTTIRNKLGGPAIVPGTDALTYARYGLWEYLEPKHKDDDRYADLRRAGKSLRGLIRVLLFKRMESSVVAFRATVERILQRHVLFAKALEEGLLPAGEEADALLGKAGREEDDAIVDGLASLKQNYVLSDFDAESLQQDVAKDILVLRSLLQLTEPITMEEDDKLQTLLSKLDTEWSGRKVLIFTQFADTAEYLSEAINPGGTRPEVEAIFGQNKSKAKIVGRFAPNANPTLAPRDSSEEITILVATDVLSEGLNMQDCDLVINYDLHWNPVRLIQRLGRIDRIGSEHEQIYAANFLPETGIEQNLGILALLRQRINEIHETIGEDAQILDETESLNEEAMFAIYQEDSSALEEPDAAETLDLNEAEEVLRRLEREDPEEYQRIASLRDGVRSSKPGEVQGVFALCQAGDFVQPVVAESNGQIITADLGRVLYLIRAERDDPTPASLPDHLGPAVQQIRETFAEKIRTRAASREHAHRLTAGQKYVLDHLKLELEQGPEEHRAALLETLRNALSQAITPAVRRELNKLKRNRVDGQALLDSLQELYSRHRLRDRVGQEHSRGAYNVPRIICSEALHG